jgi:rhodanese-related sulfurtransferase
MQEQLAHYQNKLAFEIDSWDLKVAIEAGEKIIVLDVRSPELYAEEHLPGAVNFPHRTMSEETTRELDRSILFVTYCNGIGCNGSTKGALNLTKLGFRVKELIGGIEWWKKEGYPTSKASDPTTVITCGC